MINKKLLCSQDDLSKDAFGGVLLLACGVRGFPVPADFCARGAAADGSHLRPEPGQAAQGALSHLDHRVGDQVLLGSHRLCQVASATSCPSSRRVSLYKL